MGEVIDLAARRAKLPRRVTRESVLEMLRAWGLCLEPEPPCGCINCSTFGGPCVKELPRG